MTWIKYNHVCDIPEPVDESQANSRLGWVWHCDTCSTNWLVTGRYFYLPDQQWKWQIESV